MNNLDDFMKPKESENMSSFSEVEASSFEKNSTEDQEFEIPTNRPLRTRNPNPRPFAEKSIISTRDEVSTSTSSNDVPTYYFLNISEGRVVLADLGIGLDPGQPIDLLDVANEEDILKSKDLRRALKSHGTTMPLLKRLTEEEFERLYDKWVQTQQKIEQIRAEKQKVIEKAQKNPDEIKILKGSDSNLEIRPQIQSLVEKLRIGTMNVNEKEAREILSRGVVGISPEEFLAKIDVMQLTPDEVEYIFQTVMNKEVRQVLHQKYGVK